MPKIIPVSNPKGRLAEMLGMSLGQGIGNGLNTYFANRSLESVLHDKGLQGAPQSQRIEAVRSAMSQYGETGQRLLQERMQIEQLEQQEAEREVLGRITAGQKVTEQDLRKVSPQNQLKIQELNQRRQFGKNVYENLIAAGYPEETAKLWQSQVENSTIGGLSDTITKVNGLLERSAKGKGLTEQDQTKVQSKPTIEIPGTDLGALELDFPELPQSVGMKSSDIVHQNEYREKINIPSYEAADKHLKALDEEYREVKHLQDLNEVPGGLSSGLEKWNIDWETGDVRFKALASPEEQDYVKTIARMALRAKDYFPGRVTNFDLEQFKRAFPSLANSYEGRKIIAEQLALGNRIAYLNDETYKAALDHYGSGADPILVKRYATENYRRLKSQLEQQLKEVNARAYEKAKQEENTNANPINIQEAKTVEDLFPL